MKIKKIIRDRKFHYVLAMFVIYALTVLIRYWLR